RQGGAGKPAYRHHALESCGAHDSVRSCSSNHYLCEEWTLLRGHRFGRRGPYIVYDCGTNRRRTDVGTDLHAATSLHAGGIVPNHLRTRAGGTSTEKNPRRCATRHSVMFGSAHFSLSPDLFVGSASRCLVSTVPWPCWKPR